jgi:protein-disulfide isomerase
MKTWVTPVVASFSIGTVGIVIALATTGASCGDDAAANGNVGDGPSQGGEEIRELEGIDTSELTERERRRFIEVVNDQLSPCGEPVSVAACVAERRECGKCKQAARFALRLVMEGLSTNEIETAFETRYGRETEVELPIGDAPVRGSPMAPVTIVEFSDFECPHCRQASPVLEQLVREYEGRVRVVFMNYPLDGHVHAGDAARGAVAAGNQGKFWEMHDLLFEHQDALSPEDIEGYAERLSLDLERFRADVQAAATQERIDASKELGRELGVRGTPTIFINGRRFGGELESLAAYVQEELEQ